MDVFKNLNVSASGMTANREWMDVIADNLANANTTRTPAGGPYRNKIVSFASVLATEQTKDPLALRGNGVQVGQVSEDQSPFVQIYNPSHPDADAAGYVFMPNVNPAMEMANMMLATRSYEANVAAYNASKSMYMKSLEVGK